MAKRNRGRNRKAMERVQEEVFESAVDIMVKVEREVIAATPVDEGFAQSNWHPSLNVPTKKVTEDVKPKYDGARKWSSGRPGGVLWLSNNLPYIVPLNQGHSTQQPVPGFVQRAVRRGTK